APADGATNNARMASWGFLRHGLCPAVEHKLQRRLLAALHIHLPESMVPVRTLFTQCRDIAGQQGRIAELAFQPDMRTTGTEHKPLQPDTRYRHRRQLFHPQAERLALL